MTETTRHDRIFLQVNEDSPHKFEGDVTWCEDRVHDTDVEYICRELHDQQISNLKVVHSDSIHALQQQLAEREKQLAKTQMYALGKKLLLAEREKQNVLLRDLIDHILNTYHVPRVPRITEALAATADLAGLVVCDAVPVAWHYEGSGIELPSVVLSDDLDDEQKQNCTELFARRKEK